jgi:hypothetical protein
VTDLPTFLPRQRPSGRLDGWDGLNGWATSGTMAATGTAGLMNQLDLSPVSGLLPAAGGRDARQGVTSMSALGFFRKCFLLAWASGWKTASVASFVLSLAGGAATHLWPQFGATVTLLFWLVPVVILVFCMFMGMLVASYRMCRDMERQHAVKEKELTEAASARNKALEQKIKDLEAIASGKGPDEQRRQEVKELIWGGKRLIQQIDSAPGGPSPPSPEVATNYKTWADETREYVQVKAPWFLASYDADPAVKPPQHLSSKHAEYLGFWLYISCKLVRLQELLDQIPDIRR